MIRQYIRMVKNTPAGHLLGGWCLDEIGTISRGDGAGLLEAKAQAGNSTDVAALEREYDQATKAAANCWPASRPK